MKKLITILLIFAFGISFYSCLKPDPQLRVQNNYSNAVCMKVGDVYFGVVNPNQTTGYKSVANGANKVYFNCSSTSSSTVTFKGLGKHNWVLTISGSGNISVAKG